MSKSKLDESIQIGSDWVVNSEADNPINPPVFRITGITPKAVGCSFLGEDGKPTERIFGMPIKRLLQHYQRT